jgi:1,4-dihydroxy-2-naphthoate octaprenyltransferase
MRKDYMDRESTAVDIWRAQTRGNFLLLSVVLVGIGLSLAAWRMSAGDVFSFLKALLLVIGVVLAHISVNLFNEYSDYRTGIDFKTRRTPFSGGSGMMQAGKTSPRAVQVAAIVTLFVALMIGVYFCIISHWLLIFIVAMGGIAIVFYTDYLAKWLVGELFAGLTLGSLVVIGSYIAMTGNWQMPLNDVLPLEVLLVSLPPGILTSLLLFLNEFPDVEADREGGRFHLVIWLGRGKASYLYALGLFLVFALIIALPIFKLAPPWILLALLTLPVAIRAGVTAIRYAEDTQSLLPALGMNVIVVLATDALLAVGYLITLL